MNEEENYAAFDDDAEEVERVKKPKKRKLKADKEGSKKNKKAKGIKGIIKTVIIGGLVLGIGAGLLSIKNNSNSNISDAERTNDNCYMAVYTMHDQDPDTYYLDDYYVYSENGSNYLVRFDNGVDGAYSVLDNAVIEGIGKRDDGVTPLEGTKLLEDIVETSTIEGRAKGMSQEVNNFVVYADGNVIGSCLADPSCLDQVDGYDVDGTTYTDVEEYIQASYSAKTSSASK